MEITPFPSMNDALAVASFGLFHFAAFGGNLTMMAFAMAIGAIWQVCVNAGEHSTRYAPFFGLGFAVASHVTWNLMVKLATEQAAIAPLIVNAIGPAFPELAPLGLALIPLIYLLALVAAYAYRLIGATRAGGVA